MSQTEALREALRVSPDNIPLRLLFAEACLSEYSFDEARESFEKVLALESTNRAAQLGLARTLFLSGNTSESAVRTESFLAAHPHDPSAHLLMSRIFAAEGNLNQAREHYEKVQETQPGLKDEGLEKTLKLADKKPSPPSPKVPLSASWESSEPEALLEMVEGEGGVEMDSPWSDFEKPDITFADVGGMENVKEEIRMKVLYPMQNPDLFKAYGKKMGGGVLLYGPPGCGKTLLSRATAGEMNASFFSIGIHQILDLFLGNSEKNLHEIFENARRNAPCILFFDEVDALAADRNDLRKSAGRTLINQFLAELDGSSGDNDGLLILGATNAPWHIDPAFRRPGRFDRILFIPPPDEVARRAIIDILARDKPITGLDSRSLSIKTRDFSGADLKSVFDITIERSLSKAMTEGRLVPLTNQELTKTAQEIKPSTKAWFESARNYAIYANQGGFYDDILVYLGIKK